MDLAITLWAAPGETVETVLGETSTALPRDESRGYVKTRHPRCRRPELVRGSH